MAHPRSSYIELLENKQNRGGDVFANQWPYLLQQKVKSRIGWRDVQMTAKLAKGLPEERESVFDVRDHWSISTVVTLQAAHDKESFSVHRLNHVLSVTHFGLKDHHEVHPRKKSILNTMSPLGDCTVKGFLQSVRHQIRNGG